MVYTEPVSGAFPNKSKCLHLFIPEDNRTRSSLSIVGGVRYACKKQDHTAIWFGVEAIYSIDAPDGVA